MSDQENKGKIVFDSIQDIQDEWNDEIMKSAGKDPVMMELIRKATGSTNNSKHVPRLAFIQKPRSQNHYAGIYKLKRDLLPDMAIKQIRIKNLLVAAILRARGNILSMMGHPRKDRFDIGVDVGIRPEFREHIEPEQMGIINERINKFSTMLANCGNIEGLPEDEKMNLPEYLDISTRNGLSFGRFATEIIRDDNTGEFHRFRPADVGTIYPTVKKGEAADGVRQASLSLLESITGDKEYKLIDRKKFERDEYAWVQVVDGMPHQAFTTDEMIVYNLYPSSDVEHNGYPVTPLDTIMTSISTFASIEAYNRLYFQNGRGARGMLVIQSDNIDQAALEDIKQQYNASINDVSNVFRTPIFGISREDNVIWTPTTATKKDGEFEFLFDQVTRNILAAFNISPDELPGFNHLCLSPTTNIWTDKGFTTIGEMLNGQNEVGDFKVWTGTEFVDARAFVTGERPVCKTKTSNGMEITTSPEHRFRVVDDSGEMAWVEQKDLKIGDVVLTNKKDIEGFEVEVPELEVIKEVYKSLAQKIVSDEYGIYQEYLENAITNSKDIMACRSVFEAWSKEYNIEIPKWVNDYHFEQIISLDSTSEVENMVDIEVFNEEHAFMANGIIVHNSRGTAQKTLSESSNEHKLTAARDAGLRPLILRMEDFLNEKLFPIMDAELSQLCYISLSGLDAETRQEETIRLQQNMSLFYDYDSVQQEVEKEPIGRHLGGKVPFNTHIRQIFDTYLETNRVVGELFDSPSAMVDPLLKYRRDPFWFQNLQVLQQVNPLAIKAYFASRKNAYEVFKMLVRDYLDEEQK